MVRKTYNKRKFGQTYRAELRRISKELLVAKKKCQETFTFIIMSKYDVELYCNGNIQKFCRNQLEHIIEYKDIAPNCLNRLDFYEDRLSG
jgi:RNase P protein component